MPAMRPITPTLAFLAVLALRALPAYPADAPAAPTTQPAPRLRPAEDGSILLHAKDAAIHGTTVRYEPQPNKNTIGYWTKKDDWVSWEFETTKSGTYHVNILQGCGKGSGGSEVELTFTAAESSKVGEKHKDAREGQQAKAAGTLKFTVEDTGGFQNFVSRDIGTVELPAGVYTLAVKPLSKPGLAVMDMRSVTLKPAEQGPGDRK